MKWTAEQYEEYLARRTQGVVPVKAKKPSKLKNQPVVIDGFHFPSKLEGNRYSELKLLQKSGVITHFLRQVPFHLPGNVTYRLDFLVFWADGRIGYEDTKGYETPMFKVKKKLVEAEFPVVIELVKKR